MDIKLKDFEGPLDLLLHLVSKYEVDIYDVPIVEVIEQYLTLILKMLQNSWNKAIISLLNIHWKFMLAPLLPF